MAGDATVTFKCLWRNYVDVVAWYYNIRKFLVFNHAKLPQIEYKIVSTLVPFETTYLFESGFSSALHLKKNKYRNRLNPSKVCVKVWADNFREAAKMSLGWFLMSSKAWKLNSMLSAFCCVFSGPNVTSRAATSWYFRVGKWLYVITKFVFKTIVQSPPGCGLGYE